MASTETRGCRQHSGDPCLLREEPRPAFFLLKYTSREASKPGEGEEAVHDAPSPMRDGEEDSERGSLRQSAR